MSISYERFQEKLRELKELTGYNGQVAARALYERLMHTDVNDFDKAVESMAQSDDRINLNNLLRHISRHMTARIEVEAEERKRKDREENLRFWKAHFVAGECVNHECWKCPKSYCNIVSNACIVAVREMLAKEKTVEEAHKTLADSFPGLGFENHLPESTERGPF